MSAPRSPQASPTTKESKTFRLDKEVMRQVEVLAEQQNRTVNNMVETILKNTVQGKTLAM